MLLADRDENPFERDQRPDPATVSCSNVHGPIKGTKGFGLSSVLSGQKRSPLPPAMITAYTVDIRFHATRVTHCKGATL